MKETNAERLSRMERIIEAILFKQLKTGNNFGVADDLAWLFERAQRAQELEETVAETPITVQTQDFVYSGPCESVSLHILKEMSLLRKKLRDVEVNKNYREGSE